MPDATRTYVDGRWVRPHGKRRQPIINPATETPFGEAIEIANDSDYGLSGYVWSDSRDRALAVAGELRTGMVHINGASLDSSAPFGGFKKSGIGREWGQYGLEEFLEYKSVYGGAG